KFTVSLDGPCKGLAVKLATGGWLETLPLGKTENPSDTAKKMLLSHRTATWAWLTRRSGSSGTTTSWVPFSLGTPAARLARIRPSLDSSAIVTLLQPIGGKLVPPTFHDTVCFPSENHCWPALGRPTVKGPALPFTVTVTKSRASPPWLLRPVMTKSMARPAEGSVSPG